MTCVVGLVAPDRVLIGADSASGDTAQWHVTQERTPKVFRVGDMLLGFTSSWRMGQLLRWRLPIPGRPDEQDAHEYLATTFIDAVRDCLKSGGFSKKENEVEQGGTFLIAYCGRLFEVQSDYHVGESAEAFAAVGCGRDYALGALHVMAGSKIGPEQRVTAALRAAANYSAYVRPPFRLLSIPTSRPT